MELENKKCQNYHLALKHSLLYKSRGRRWGKGSTFQTMAPISCLPYILMITWHET